MATSSLPRDHTKVTMGMCEIVEEPKCGMMFDSVEQLVQYYRLYGSQIGFATTKRSRKLDDSGNLKHITLACSRARKAHSNARNPMHMQPTCKTDCQARLHASVGGDGRLIVLTVVTEHNHALSPSKARFFSSNKIIDGKAKRRLELNDQAGIPMCQNFNTFVVEAGGYENLTFGERDCRNYISKARSLRLGEGDAKAVFAYFQKMQEKNSNFFYVFDLDDDSRIQNMFWADARSRASFEYFGDVITFDTTYLTNKYDMPFAPFVGVNHHGQSILMGCGLLSSENTKSFIWLFESWDACMSGHPNAIITDQDRAISKAVEIVFPRSRHRWCLWHILKKVPEKLRGYGDKYDTIRSAMHNAVYDSLTTHEFEDKWDSMIEEYELGNNDWLTWLYEQRQRWVPAFVKDIFWAGMSTTQRSESMNAFFDGYVNSKTSLKQFVEQYDNALRSKVEKEMYADYISFHKNIPCITKFSFEKQLQKVYTVAKFKDFQDELRCKIYCQVLHVDDQEGQSLFVIEEMIHEPESFRKISVCYVEFGCQIYCQCRLFEHKGILCRHAITVMQYKKIFHLSDRYILNRWRKDIPRRHSRVRVGYGGLDPTPKMQRYNMMFSKFSEAADMGVQSDKKCTIALDGLSDLCHKLSITDAEVESDANHGIPPEAMSSFEERGLNEVRVNSPLRVPRKGRPPQKRKESIVDKAVRSLKLKGKGKKQNAKRDRQSDYVNPSGTPTPEFFGTQESINVDFMGGTTQDIYSADAYGIQYTNKMNPNYRLGPQIHELSHIGAGSSYPQHFTSQYPRSTVSSFGGMNYGCSMTHGELLNEFRRKSTHESDHNESDHDGSGGEM